MAEANPPSGNQDNFQLVKIEDEMRGAYLDYAMSVIVGRALPDVRDGLKPVHRRALFAMYDLGNTFNKPYKKSARVVGDVIGKYHPHGDQAVYDTIVRMAQDFSLRYPLVDGQGNFGSIDGDNPAAMRYTEIRMERITDELLGDIEKETVDFVPNYDESLQEPSVLPAKFPNLLVNGASGIAVGMATNIPPHNLGEIIDASCALIDDPSMDVTRVLDYVKGPDFPTGAQIFSGVGLRKAYLKGRGVITLRANVEIEPYKKDRERIVVSEIPYQVNKARLIEKIADLVREKRIEGIADIRDESDRQGLRVVLDLKKGESSNIILNRLYKLTQLQESYGITLLAIHNNRPRIMNIKEMIWAFIEHRKDVILRRTAFDLRKAKAKAHILEGLKRAVENLDAVIKLIRGSKGPNEARTALMSQFQFSEKQSQAILDMRLQKLTGLEREKLVTEYEETLKVIEELKSILGSEARVFEIIREELQGIKERYGDQRRTQIVAEAVDSFEVEDLIADEATLVTLTHKGYIKRTDPKVFRSQGRGGKGIKAAATSEGDFVSQIFKTTTLSYLLCFTSKGQLHFVKVYQIPEGSRTSKGKAIVNLINLTPGEKVVAVLPVKEFTDSKFLVFATEKGMVKKTSLSDYKNIRSKGLAAIGILPGDSLISVKISSGKDDIFFCTKEGMGIRFNEEKVRSMGRTARGVAGMNLANEDQVIGMGILDMNDEFGQILTVTENGYGKRTPIDDYRVTGRGGKGVVTAKLSDRTGKVVAVCQARASDEVMLVSSRGELIRMAVAGISQTGRATQGVRLMNVSGGERVVALEYLPNDEEEESKLRSSSDEDSHEGSNGVGSNGSSDGQSPDPEESSEVEDSDDTEVTD